MRRDREGLRLEAITPGELVMGMLEDALKTSLSDRNKFTSDKDKQIEALTGALADTLNMLRAAHMQCGVHHDGNKRVIKAREILAKAKGQPQATEESR